MSYGELTLSPERKQRNAVNGQFLKGHEPHNKGKKWGDYMSKRKQKRSAKGWANLERYRQTKRPDTACRCRKQIIAVMDDGCWICFAYSGDAARWCGGNSDNVRRCCRRNQSRIILRDTHGKPTNRINTNHYYMGVRFYFETDNTWLTKIKN